jgi:hypothetical protein
MILAAAADNRLCSGRLQNPGGVLKALFSYRGCNTREPARGEPKIRGPEDFQMGLFQNFSFWNSCLELRGKTGQDPVFPGACSETGQVLEQAQIF